MFATGAPAAAASAMNFGSGGNTKAKAWRANTPTELRELFVRASEVTGAGHILVQSLIPGDGRNQFAYCAFFKDGKAVGSIVSQRLRQHPREFGRASTYVETIDLPVLESLSERFLRAINGLDRTLVIVIENCEDADLGVLP